MTEDFVVCCQTAKEHKAATKARDKVRRKAAKQAWRESWTARVCKELGVGDISALVIVSRQPPKVLISADDACWSLPISTALAAEYLERTS